MRRIKRIPIAVKKLQQHVATLLQLPPDQVAYQQHKGWTVTFLISRENFPMHDNVLKFLEYHPTAEQTGTEVGLFLDVQMYTTSPAKKRPKFVPSPEQKQAYLNSRKR